MRYAGHSGVRATCADCHIPHGYLEKLWYKANGRSESAEPSVGRRMWLYIEAESRRLGQLGF